MASTTFVFLLLVTIFSPLLLQIHARDSQFFSKVTTKPTDTQTQTVVLPDKEQEQKSLVDKQETEPTQQPEFVPQNENGYGLYGHETGLNPPDTEVLTSTEAPATYSSEKYYNNDKNGDFTEQFGNGNGNGETFYSNNGEKLDASTETEKDDLLNFDDTFDTSKDREGETFYNNNHNGVGTEHYSTGSTQKDNIGETYYNTDRSGQFGSQLGQTETYYNDNRFDNRFTDELNSRYKAYRGESNVERKGMSDTRFVENGRYYYDLDKEQNQYDSRNTYNPKYKDVGSRAYQSNEVVGNTKYDDASYDNSGADKYEFNTMEEYEKSRLNQYDP